LALEDYHGGVPRSKETENAGSLLVGVVENQRRRLVLGRGIKTHGQAIPAAAVKEKEPRTAVWRHGQFRAQLAVRVEQFDAFRDNDTG